MSRRGRRAIVGSVITLFAIGVGWILADHGASRPGPLLVFVGGEALLFVEGSPGARSAIELELLPDSEEGVLGPPTVGTPFAHSAPDQGSLEFHETLAGVYFSTPTGADTTRSTFVHWPRPEFRDDPCDILFTIVTVDDEHGARPRRLRVLARGTEPIEVRPTTVRSSTWFQRLRLGAERSAVFTIEPRRPDHGDGRGGATGRSRHR